MVTFEPQILLDELSVLVRWSSDRTPPVTFTVYEDGKLVDQFDDDYGVGERIVSATRPYQTFLDVTDLEGSRPLPAFPPEFVLNWQEALTAESYRIEQYNGATWDEIDSLDSQGLAALNYKTERIEDQDTPQYRVTAIDVGGGESPTPLEFTGKMVRIPDAPDATFTFTPATRRFTIAEAA